MTQTHDLEYWHTLLHLYDHWQYFYMCIFVPLFMYIYLYISYYYTGIYTLAHDIDGTSTLLNIDYKGVPGCTLLSASLPSLPNSK